MAQHSRTWTTAVVRLTAELFLLAETRGDADTKEELVQSEYGGGQDTEPLRPSTTGSLPNQVEISWRP